MNVSGEGSSDLRFSHTQTYFDKSRSVRFLIATVFVLILFMLLHFRETYVESLEMGSFARRYVVAQTDFAFPDDEATVIFKQEMARRIGPIYKIKSEQIQSRLTDFQKYVAQTHEGSEKWNALAEEGGFKELALALSQFSDALLQSRFTNLQTLGTIDELPEADLPIPKPLFFAFLPHEGQEGRLPLQFWAAFSKSVFAESPLSSKTLNFVLSYFEGFSWQFESDQGTQYTLRKLIAARLPEKYTHVRSGERVIDQGEKVTSRHLMMLQAMKEKLDEERHLNDPLTIVGSFLIALLFLFVGAIYLRENHREIITSNKRLSLLLSVIVLNLLIAKAIEMLFLDRTSHFVDLIRFPLFVPFAAILLSSLMHVRLAAFATLFLAIFFTMALPVASISFLIVNILSATVAILGMRQVRRRKEVFAVCAKGWFAAALVILAFNLYESSDWTYSFLSDLTSALLFMLITAVAVVGLLPLFESLFGVMTDMTVMELMDPSNPLLRRLTIEAPGTYQHSMVVGNLAEAAASAIGANGLFCRVAAAYHDVGKLVNPEYFTENQLGGVDMHRLLTPRESADVIIAHVSEGVALARQVGLSEPFIDIIKEHHGTTLVYYFYHKEIEQKGGDKSLVDERDFRYSGPKPHTKESTILMMADSLEAASRSLDLFNEETISSLVQTLVAQKSEDGQFDDSPLTFEEMGAIKRTLVKNLLAASHPRIKYPLHHPGEEG